MIRLKFIAIAGLIALTSCTVYSEDPPEPRTIEVTGSAEMAVQPDEIQLSIVLRSPSGQDKEKAFMKILADNGVDEDKVSFESSNNRNWWWYYSRYYDHTVQRYTVTIDSTVNSIELMEDLKESWVEQVRVTDKSNRRIQEYRKQVKIEAIKAAKEKASYMLEALGEELGSVVTITEVNTDHNTSSPYYYWGYNNSSSVVSNSVISSNQGGQSTVDGVAMQTLRYEVNVVFNIKE